MSLLNRLKASFKMANPNDLPLSLLRTVIFSDLLLNIGVFEILEASPGIEPGYADLQSAASPLRHEAQ